MKIEDLVKLYETSKEKYGEETYRYLSAILSNAKERHKQDFAGNDHEQSWRAFKGKNLEKLIEYIVVDEIQKIGFEIVDGGSLERTFEENLSPKFAKVKQNLYIDYGVYGVFLPDADLIIFEPKTSKVIAILSIKVTLRERVAQTGYWKIKLSKIERTKHIKVYFITLDEDGTLTSPLKQKKGRAIVEIDTDGSYLLTEAKIVESEKVKMFDKFLIDLKKTKKIGYDKRAIRQRMGFYCF